MSDEIYKAELVAPPLQPTNNRFPPNPNEYETAYNGVAPPRKSGLLLVMLIIAGAGVGFMMIIAILFAMLIPATNSARDAARRMHCNSNIKRIVIALHAYHDMYQSFPPAYTVDSEGNPLHSWRVLILPYIEEQPLYDCIRLDEPWDSEYNSQFHSTISKVYTCPNRPSSEWNKGLTPYQFVVGPDCISDGPNCVKLKDITNGTANTIVLLESCKPVCWMEPKDIAYNDLDYGVAQDITNPGNSVIGGYHAGGVNAGMADGSVSFISSSVSASFLKKQCKIR